MEEMKLDPAQWNETVSSAQNSLKAIEAREKTTIERTTLKKLRSLMHKHEKINSTVRRYALAADKATSTMKEAARKVTDQDRAMAREFDANARNMVKFG